MKKQGLLFFVMYLCICSSRAQPCFAPISDFPDLQKFEASDGSWLTGGVASDWEWGTPAKSIITSGAASDKCWITGGLSKPAYNDNQRSWLISPCYDFTSLQSPFISFNIFWDTEREFDGANIQYTTDNGATWHLIGEQEDNPVECKSFNWFNGPGIFGLSGLPGWAGNTRDENDPECSGGFGSKAWRMAKHILPELAGEPTVRFRFNFGSGSSCNTFNGFAIDNFSVSEAPPNYTAFLSGCAGNNRVDFSYLSDCAQSVSWNFGDPASGAANTSNVPYVTHQFSGPGSYTVTLNVVFFHGAPGVRTDVVNILGGTPVIDWPGACSNLPDATLSIAGLTGSTSPYNYSWNTTPPQTTPSITNVGPGNYTVRVTSFRACEASFRFSLPATTPVTITSVSKDATCKQENGSITTSVSGGATPYTYAWSNGSSNANATGLAEGTYALTVSDAKGCATTHDPTPIGMNDYQIPVSLGPDRRLCPGQLFVLSPGRFASYLWQDGSSASTYEAKGEGLYYVMVTDTSGCHGKDTVRFAGDCVDINFPSAFTPNMDNNNDYFGPIGNLPALSNFYMSIFDRYGQRIFHTNDPYKKWDGSFKQLKPDSGTYVWVSGFTFNGKHELRKGTIILIR